MATVIRFSRHGTKKKPYFRMVVQNKTAPRDGRFIEHIGAYDPQKGDKSLVVKRDRLQYWMGVGAQVSDSVKNRLKVSKANALPTTPPEPKAPKPPRADKPEKAKKAKSKEA